MSSDDFVPGGDSIDLTNCDREPIHLLGHVQSFGCLIAVTTDWMVQHASLNVESMLGHRAEDIIGVPFATLIAPEAPTIGTTLPALKRMCAALPTRPLTR